MKEQQLVDGNEGGLSCLWFESWPSPSASVCCCVFSSGPEKKSVRKKSGGPDEDAGRVKSGGDGREGFLGRQVREQCPNSAFLSVIRCRKLDFVASFSFPSCGSYKILM